LPNIDKIIKDLKNRKVFKSAAIYLATAFVFLQAAQLIIPALLIPSWTFRLLVVVAILGFPAVLIFSWIYDITPAPEDKEPGSQDGQETESISDTSVKVSPSTKNIILISTLLGIIFYTNILPLLQDLVNADRSFKTAVLTPGKRLYTKYEHPDNVSDNIRMIKHYLFKGDERNNHEALTLAEELIFDDYTQADYYAYRGKIYFQFYEMNKERHGHLLLQSKEDFIRAIDLANMNREPAVISYLHLASIHLIQENVDDAYSMIKKAMQTDKTYPDVKIVLKAINKRRILGPKEKTS